ncbi:hypothetical protein [Flavobacterium sp.]|uniref:hypothetical protein n=1 Tax=Flavobacterium sp. TaxID=239 RepID=UPI0025C285EE|nr:hypothetical protein [Flavobacterium sp.]MBA4153994.1 hypothetical protein [Flavobacterium sp.]
MITNFWASANSFFSLIPANENAETFGSEDEITGISILGLIISESIVSSFVSVFCVELTSRTVGTISTEVIGTSIAPNLPKK